MQLFFCKDYDKEFRLSVEESRHVVKVLRKNIGEKLYFTDGKGMFLTGEIITTDKIITTVKIIKKEKKSKNHNYSLHIAIAPTKNMDRFEWFLEKSTEIGIDEITPIICSNSERKIIKLERCNRILKSAMKQSLKFYLPKLNEPIMFKDFIQKKHEGKKYIAHCQEYKKIKLKKENTSMHIMIGPEGDFTEEEIRMATEKKFSHLSLGNSRLRTETAGLVATQSINMIYN